MARPKKQPHEKRDRRFNLRYTAAEIEHIRIEAHKAGLDPHEFARRRTLGAPVRASRTQCADPALINELNRIGVNLNQLARAVNRGRDESADWGELALELKRTLALVMASDGPETS
ncbi:plasmid mobilization protein [Hyphococcus luteus]|nr:plasmid mobilization relaxosome protein MobC [Marinicaulis flavus]